MFFCLKGEVEENVEQVVVKDYNYYLKKYSSENKKDASNTKELQQISQVNILDQLFVFLNSVTKHFLNVDYN